MSGYMTRQELCDAVYRAVRSSDKPLSRLEICRAIGRKKSPHILSMMEELTAGGWFIKSEAFDKWDRPLVVYSLGEADGGACL